MSEEEGFLSRWSRRKRAEVQPAPATPEPTPPVATAPEKEPEFDLASLPAIEDLDAGSDIAAFMQKGVPDAIRNAALRKFWALDPDIAAIKGPVDYAWDFNDPNAMHGFGPMEAGYDSSAMLKQVMGIVEPEPDDAVAASSDQVVEPVSELVPSEPPARISADEQPVPEALPSDVNACDAEIRKMPENQNIALRKRHGGALPEI